MMLVVLFRIVMSIVGFCIVEVVFFGALGMAVARVVKSFDKRENLGVFLAMVGAMVAAMMAVLMGGTTASNLPPNFVSRHP